MELCGKKYSKMGRKKQFDFFFFLGLSRSSQFVKNYQIVGIYNLPEQEGCCDGNPNYDFPKNVAKLGKVKLISTSVS